MMSLNHLDAMPLACLFLLALIVLYKASKTLLGCTLITCCLISVTTFFPKNIFIFPVYTFLSVTPILFFNVRHIKDQIKNKEQLYSDLMELLCACVSVSTLFIPSFVDESVADLIFHVVIASLPLIYSEFVRYVPPREPTKYELEQAEIAAERYFSKYGFNLNRMNRY